MLVRLCCTVHPGQYSLLSFSLYVPLFFSVTISLFASSLCHPGSLLLPAVPLFIPAFPPYRTLNDCTAFHYFMTYLSILREHGQIISSIMYSALKMYSTPYTICTLCCVKSPNLKYIELGLFCATDLNHLLDIPQVKSFFYFLLFVLLVSEKLRKLVGYMYTPVVVALLELAQKQNISSTNDTIRSLSRLPHSAWT